MPRKLPLTSVALTVTTCLFSFSGEGPAFPSDGPAPPGPLALPAWPPRQIDPFAEPPLELLVDVGGQSLRLSSGQAGALADGTPVRAEVLPFRTFGASRVFEFDFPREWRLSGAGGEAGAWWQVMGEGVGVHVEYHQGDPAAVARERADRDHGQDALGRRPVTRTIGRREMVGEEVRSPMYWTHGGGRDLVWVKEYYGVADADGGGWLVVLERSAPRGGDEGGRTRTLELGAVSHVIELPGAWTAEDQARVAALDGIAAAWRWR